MGLNDVLDGVYTAQIEEQTRRVDLRLEMFCRDPGSPPVVQVLLDLPGEPLHPLVQPLPRHRVAGADVPRLVQQPLQTCSNTMMISLAECWVVEDCATNN